MEEEVIKYSCSSCSYESENEDDFITDYAGDPLCESCRWYCERCESTLSTDHDSYDVGGEYWCDSCRSDNAMWCDFCESYNDSDRYSVYHLQDTGNWCCEDCTDNVEFCDECDEYYEHGCNSCSSTIHSYQYKPDPIFYGTDTNKMYLGLELETEIRTNSVACRESAELITKQVPEIYLKSDSSISGQGYEIVSHPLSFNYWQDNMQHFYDTLEELRTTYNARSWDSDSCGIHIHISRNGFKSGAHMHRWINFIYKNVEDVTKYAGRGNNRYAQYGDVYKHDKYGRPYFTLKDKITNGGFTERYSAVNTQNQNTLELRVFRGTTNSNGVRATLEFAHASVEYTRDMSISDVKLGMLDWDWFKDYVQVNNGIYPNLYSRLDKCKSANLNKRELIEA